MIDIYDGTIGVMFDRDKLELELNKYLSGVHGSLAYEFKEGRTKLVIITGKNEQEKALPPFTHPFIFKTTRGEKALAIDIRPYMKSNLDDMITVREKLQDKYNGNLQLERLVYTKLFLDEQISWLGSIRPLLMEAFGTIISTITSLLTYDNSSKPIVDILAKIHFVTMCEENEIHDINSVIYKLPRKLISNLTHGEYTDTYKKIVKEFENGNLQIPSRSIGSLLHNIKTIIDNGRMDGLDPDLYIQALSRGFFSLDSKYLSIGFVEHQPTMFAILLNVITEGINSKSSFRKILMGHNRITQPKELAKVLKEVYENEIIG